MAESTRSLQSLFASAEEERKRLESYSETSSTDYQAKLQEVIASYEECEKVVDRLALFSRNEILDDISSENLRYLLIDYYLGELISKVNEADRRAVLILSRNKYGAYLDRLEAYEILSASDQKLFEEYLDNPDGFSTASSKDLAARRSVKIERFKQEKELRQKLEYLQRNPDASESDDSLLRTTYLTQIRLCTHHTFASLESIAQELQILALAPSHPAPDQTHHFQDSREERRARTGEEYSEKLDPPISTLLGGGRAGPLLNKDGKPLQPFTLLDKRDQLRRGVFRPGHNLPTMTIDEYLEEEKRRGGIIEGGGEQSGRRPVPDEDDIDKADADTMKAREWDEFKEANPKGSGNTLNRG